MKKVFVMMALAMLVGVTGCGPSVSSVRDAKMTGREQTTVGKAFDAYFGDANWELKEAANGTKFVEFTGKFKKDFPLDDNAQALIFAKDSQLIAQFLIKDKSFEVSAVQGTLSIDGTIGGDVKASLQLVMMMKGIKEGPFTMNEAAIQRLLDRIYSGN